jgi:ATP-dependent DNA helicase RecG
MLDASVPDVFRQLLGRLKSNLRTGSRIDTFRTDVPEYPDVALRETLINALVHRSLHPASLNSHVTVSLFPSRIEIVNPGGLYQVGLDEDGRPAGRSTRNSRLMEILEYLPLSKDEGMVVENRGGGIPAIVEEIRKAGLHQPRFINQIYQFTVRFPRGSLVVQETLAWLAMEAPGDLTLSQRLGAAMLHQGEELTNETYRTATGVDSVQATRELAGLVDAGLAEPEGEHRGRKYRLHPKHRSEETATTDQLPHEGVDEGVDEGVGGDQTSGAAADRRARLQWIMSEIDRLGGIKVPDIVTGLGISQATAERDITELRATNQIVYRGGPRYGRYERV